VEGRSQGRKLAAGDWFFCISYFFIFFATRLWRLLVGGCTRICFIFAGCFVAGDAATKIQLAAQKVLQMRAENLINVDTS